MRHEARQVPSWLIFDVRQKVKRLREFLVLMMLVPGAALAHGQQIVGLPIGQIAGLVVAVVAALLIRVPVKVRLLTVAVAFITLPVPWFLLDGIFFWVGEQFGYGMAPWIVIGFISPLAAALLTFTCGRRLNKEPNKAPEPTPTAVTGAVGFLLVLQKKAGRRALSQFPQRRW